MTRQGSKGERLKRMATQMKLLQSSILLGFLGSASAMAADYSVGIVNLGTEFSGGGTAVNLYETTKEGVKLRQTYVLQQYDFLGSLAKPITLAINHAHNFVYVIYTGTGPPNIVAFQITVRGLILKWEQPFENGDPDLGGSTITAGPDYVIESKYPNSLFLNVISDTGKDLLFDIGEYPFDGTYLISGHVDSTKTFYYGCRGLTQPEPGMPIPITTVWIYKFPTDGTELNVPETTPIAKSTDPAYIQSVCD
jgi:hypothetical protein